MTEQQGMESFELALSDRIHRYTNAATRRPFDAGATTRAAMSSQVAAGSMSGWPGRRWWIVLVPAAALLTIGAVVVGGLPQQQHPPAPTAPPAVVPIPVALRQPWIRPYSVSPGQNEWGSGFLAVADDHVNYGPEPGAAASTSSIEITGPTSLEITATADTKGCQAGDAGAYGWSLAGEDTVLTLTPINDDACPTRQKALAGQWVRDAPVQPVLGDALPAGTQWTSKFDPLGNAGSPTHLEFTIPEGWRVIEDSLGSLHLQRLPSGPADDPEAEPHIGVFTNPRLEADYAPGAACGPTGDAPGVGGGLDDLVAAIVARPGVVSTPPTDVSIAGHRGRILDLHLSPTWTGGCSDFSGHIVGIPILHPGGAPQGPVVGVTPDQVPRLILLDLGGGRTLAIVIFTSPTQSSDFERNVAESMPIIDSFKFVPASP
jgi:hypothetical protein